MSKRRKFSTTNTRTRHPGRGRHGPEFNGNAPLLSSPSLPGSIRFFPFSFRSSPTPPSRTPKVSNPRLKTYRICGSRRRRPRMNPRSVSVEKRQIFGSFFCCVFREFCVPRRRCSARAFNLFVGRRPYVSVGLVAGEEMEAANSVSSRVWR